jgi:hypothetical protein
LVDFLGLLKPLASRTSEPYTLRAGKIYQVQLADLERLSDVAFQALQASIGCGVATACCSRCRASLDQAGKVFSAHFIAALVGIDRLALLNNDDKHGV